MKIILTRHGETEGNATGQYQGHLPGILNKKGKEQAKKISKRLKEEHFDAIYSSDLDRASDTAKEIHREHPHTPIFFTEKLRERNLGEFQGRLKSEFKPNHNTYFQEHRERMKVETNESILKRTKELLEEIEKKHKEKTVLLVGHNGVNKALVANMLNKEILEVKSFDNCSYSEFELQEEWKTHTYNCTKHFN